MKKYCLLLFVLAFVSCTHENPPIVQDAEVLSDVAMVRVFDNTMSQSDLIRNVAEQFDIKQAVTRSEKEERAIKEIIPINGEDGEPAMYVVNYADNKGWVIVSGTTDYAPILAYNDEGNFDVSSIEGNAIEVWVDETKSAIEYMKTAPEEEKEKYHTQWMYYASKLVPITDIIPMTRDDASEALAYQMQCCAQWEAEGYEIIILGAFKDCYDLYGVSESQKDQIVDEAEYYGTDEFDGYDFNCLILVKENSQSRIDVGPFLSDSWHSGEPYCDSISPQKYPVQNYALNVARIMKYWEYPYYINWTNIPDTVSTPTTASFLKDVNRIYLRDYTFYPDTIHENESDALSIFHSYGYNNASIISHNSSQVISQLESSRPVWGKGNMYNTNGNSRSWVYDGYSILPTSFSFELTLKALQTKSSFYSRFLGQYGMFNSAGGLYFHISWGCNKNNDGNYLDSDLYYTITNTWINHYNHKRKDIINIYY